MDNGTEWQGRRDAGRAHLKAARNALAVADEGDDGRLIVQGAILSAIAFGDALTIRIAGLKNSSDHQRLPTTLRHVLGDQFPQAQSTRLSRLLRVKDDSAYGHRSMDLLDARGALERAIAFAEWAEGELGRA